MKREYVYFFYKKILIKMGFLSLNKEAVCVKLI